MKDIKIGFDTCISDNMVKKLKESGYNVVHKAGSGIPDWEWFMTGLKRGMNVVFSPDSDLETLCKRFPYGKRQKVQLVKIKQNFFQLTNDEKYNSIVSTIEKLKDDNYVRKLKERNESIHIPDGANS